MVLLPACEAVRSDDAVVSAAEVRELKKRIRDLERVLGKNTLENEILTEAVKLAHEKKLISRMASAASTACREVERGGQAFDPAPEGFGNAGMNVGNVLQHVRETGGEAILFRL